jgi:hypothetical protein
MVTATTIESVDRLNPKFISAFCTRGCEERFYFFSFTINFDLKNDIDRIPSFDIWILTFDIATKTLGSYLSEKLNDKTRKYIMITKGARSCG